MSESSISPTKIKDFGILKLQKMVLLGNLMKY